MDGMSSAKGREEKKTKGKVPRPNQEIVDFHDGLIEGDARFASFGRSGFFKFWAHKFVDHFRKLLFICY